MIDRTQKNAILAAEREFERRENLSRALALSGVTLIGRITSPPPVDADPAVLAAATAGSATGSDADAELDGTSPPAGSR